MSPMYLRVEYTGLYMPPMYLRVGYTRLYASLPYLLGCTIPLYMPPYYTTLGILHPVHRWSLYYTPGVLCWVYSDEALGSVLRFTLGMRRIEPSFLPSCYDCWEVVRRVTPLFHE